MKDEDTNEFDYYDEYPDEDPFIPKPTCTLCKGSGITEDAQHGHTFRCSRCYGTGVEQ